MLVSFLKYLFAIRRKNLLVILSNKKALSCMLCFFLLLLSVFTEGQVQQKPASLPDSTIERKLAELAMNGPEMLQAAHRSKVFEYQLKTAKNTWTNLLTISANYNDQTFKKSVATTTTAVYPKYFFGLNIPLGTLLSRTQVKAANEAVEIGKLEEEQLRRKIRTDVITKYRQYKARAELVGLETAMYNDIEASLAEARLKFRKNEITFEAYNAVQRAKTDEQTKIINLKLELDLIKLDIEQIIGTSLESVMENH